MINVLPLNDAHLGITALELHAPLKQCRINKSTTLRAAEQMSTVVLGGGFLTETSSSSD